MKNIKKLFSVLMALTLVFSFGATAFATGTITVANPGTYNYVAYKIFDATEDDGEVSYTLAEDSEWKDVLLNADGSSKFDGLSFTGPTSGAYTVVKGNTFSAADFAEFLRGENDANLTGKTGTDFSAAEPITATVEPGYYLVISDDGTDNQDKAALTTVLEDENVTIQNKNDMPFDKLVDDVKVEGVQIGDELDFTINGKVPTVEATDTVYIYLVSDTMDEGLTFDESSFSVTIGGDDVSLTVIRDPSAILTGDQVRFAPNANGKTFELSLDMLNRVQNGDATAGDDVVISYTAKVNENAQAVVSENKAVLEYGNDPTDLTIKDSQTKNYTSKIMIDKYETGAPEQKLEGAKFVLYKEENGSTLYYYYDEAAKEVQWIEESELKDDSDAAVSNPKDAANITIVTTDTSGAASFIGLEDGAYKLLEIEAPAGYTRLTAPIDVEVDGEAATAVGLSDEQIVLALTNVANVANTPGTNLPSTGGIGTTIFYAAGAILFVGAAVVLIARKRSDAES